MRVNLITRESYLRDAAGVGGVTTGAVNLTNFITLHSDPVEAFHPTTKQYVDNALAAHTTDNSIHITPEKNSWLNAITLTPAEINSIPIIEQSLQDLIETKQDKLVYTPVQQGGGINQLDTKIHIGWTGTHLAVKTGDTDHETMWPINITGTAGSVIWTNVTLKPTTLSGYGIADGVHSSHIGSGGSVHSAATQTTSGFMTPTDKTKLDSIAFNANNYVHPDSGVIPGSYSLLTVNAEGHITEGSNPTTLEGYGITDATPSSHIGSGKNSHAVATTTAHGFMSSLDKDKLDGIEDNANNYIHPVSGVTAGTYTKFTVDVLGHITAAANLIASDIPNLDASKITSGTLVVDRLPNSGITAGTYSTVTVDEKGRVTSGGTISSGDIPELDWSHITSGLPTTLSGYGITDATPSSHIGSTGNAHGAATTTVNGFMSSADKTKLDGIATNANNYVHPNSTVTAGTYTKFTVNSQGHITSGTTLTTSDIPDITKTGTIIRVSNSTTPLGYLKCDGTGYSTSAYTQLYNTIGYRYGQNKGTSKDYVNVTLTYTSYSSLGHGKYWENQTDFSSNVDLSAINYHGLMLPKNLHLSATVVTKNKAYLIGGYTGTRVSLMKFIFLR